MSHQTAAPGPPPMIRHVVEPEGEEHGLLQPLMDPPFPVGLLGDAGLAVVEHPQGGLDRLADGAPVKGPTFARSSQAASMVWLSSAWDMRNWRSETDLG